MWPKEICLPHSGGTGNEQKYYSELTDPFFLPQNSFPPVPTPRPVCAFPYSRVGCLGQKGRMEGKATALDLGEEEEDSQPSFQVTTALQVDY